MKTFEVFKHSTLGFQAVKVGFSWPGFFFSGIWLFVKKLWWHGFAFIGAAILLTILENKFEGGAGEFLGLLGTAGLSFFIGIKGNEWRETNLQQRGFEIVKTIQTDTADAAIGKTAKT